VLIVCAIGGGAVVVMGGATIATQPTQAAPAVDVAALVAPITQPMDDATLVLQVGGEMARPYLAQRGMDLAAQGTGLIAQGLVWYAEATGETPPDGSDTADAQDPARGLETLAPGSHAGESIPARGAGRDFTAEEREQIDSIGRNTGCHTCGAINLGTKDGHFVPDHQPPNALNPDNEQQRLYPHCISCSRRQGGQIRTYQRRLTSKPE
jgi:hypothetical protein